MVDPIYLKSIKSKADAMHFAIVATMQHRCGENSRIDYDEAEKLYDFFCSKVTFPEDPAAQLVENIIPFLENVAGIPNMGNQGNGWCEGKPAESEAIAVVRTVEYGNNVELRLASYSKQQQQWLNWCNDEIIDNVTHYFPIRHLPH